MKLILHEIQYVRAWADFFCISKMLVTYLMLMETVASRSPEEDGRQSDAKMGLFAVCLCLYVKLMV